MKFKDWAEICSDIMKKWETDDAEIFFVYFIYSIASIYTWKDNARKNAEIKPILAICTIINPYAQLTFIPLFSTMCKSRAVGSFLLIPYLFTSTTLDQIF